MTLRNYSTHLLCLCLALVMASCAKQGMPSGGPKDTEPPKALATRPVNGSTGFNAKQFFIQFDEYVTIKDAENNILVSPPMAQKPEYRTKGKGLLVKLRDTLRENTTYLFQFKGAIVDFTEGNPLPSMEYVFSTGDCLDSMTLRGSVIDALTMAPSDKVVSVLLIDTLDSGKTAYATRCDKDGNFRFNYIRGGGYSILALIDENRNLQVDTSETVAFLDRTFCAVAAVDSAKSAARLVLFSPDVEKQRVTSADFKAKGKIVITTKLPMKAPRIDAGGEKLVWIINSRGDTVRVWTLRAGCDSVRLTVKDATGIDDTLQLRWRQKRKGMASLSLNEPMMKMPMKSLPFFDTLKVSFSTPLDTAKCRTDSAVTVMLMKDSSVCRCPVAIDSTGMLCRLFYPFRQGEKYDINIAPRCFFDIHGNANDSLHAVITVTSAEEYGDLHVELLNGQGEVAKALIVQLLDEKGKTVREQLLWHDIPAATFGEASPLGKVHFLHLAPAKYRLRVIHDANGNGKWDTGNYFDRRQPERVQMLGKTLDVRANWEYEERMVVE